MRPTLFAVFFCFCLRFVQAQTILHVTPTGAGTRSGNSWANALSGVDLPVRLPIASPGTQFWIAAGMYKPTTTTDRTASFSIASGTSVYGGFLGTETTLAQRPGYSDFTYLSGDIGVAGDSQDNSVHVVRLVNNSQPVTIEGLTIYGGHSVAGEGAGIYVVSESNGTLNLTVSSCRITDNVIENTFTGGGGIYAEARAGSKINLTIRESYLAGNRAGFGGGYCAQMSGGYIETHIENTLLAGNKANLEAGAISHNYVGNDPLNSLTVTNCRLVDNTAFLAGGAIVTGTGSCSIDQCVFSQNVVTFQNSATLGNGGAVDGSGANAIYKNCLFSDNTAAHGGGVYSSSERFEVDQTFSNCTFANNSASISGGAFYNTQFVGITPGGGFARPLTTRLSNCIIWGNTAPDSPAYKVEYGSEYSNLPLVNYSLIQALDPVIYTTGYWGVGNRNADPLFVDPANGDFRLKSTSPAINAGDPNTTGSPTTDLAGQARVQGGRVDMGAYEFMACAGPVCLPIVVVRNR